METVLSTRQQIESRNPSAFAPKVIHTSEPGLELGVRATTFIAVSYFLSPLLLISSPSILQDFNNKTPASARHKRGCNCKKSSCLKKYCECFQVLIPTTIQYLFLFGPFFLEISFGPFVSVLFLLFIKGGVGCSISCRCEGCKNAFGRREGESNTAS